MFPPRLLVPLAIYLFYALLMNTVSATNLVGNPGFETGSFSPWVTSGDGFATVAVESSQFGIHFVPHTGTYFAELGNTGPGGGDEQPTFLTQTISGLAGGSYTISYYYAIFDMPFSGCWLSSLLGGSTLVSTTLFPSVQGAGYFQVSTNFTLPAGTPSSNALQLALECDVQALLATIGVDDVTVTAI